MEALATLLLVGLVVWVIWQWVKVKTHDTGGTETAQSQPSDDRVRAAAEAEGHDYVLEPFEGGSGRGYTLRRVDDWQKLRWQSADSEPGLLPFNVSGESHRMEDLQNPSFAPGSRISLVPEPDNPYDSNAVAVCSQDESLQAGYVPAELAEEVGHLIERHPDHLCVSMWESRAEGERKALRVLLAYGDINIGIV